MDRDFDKYEEEYLLELLVNLAQAKDDLCKEEEDYLEDLEEYLNSNYDGMTSPRETGKSYKIQKVIQGSKIDE